MSDQSETVNIVVDETPEKDINDNEETQSTASFDKSEPPCKRQRFEASSAKSIVEWDLPEDLAIYLKDKTEIFIKDSDIQESILKDNPVPSNIIKPKKLDTAFREILEEQYKKTALSNEEMLSNIQNKVFSVLGPLTKLWATMEGEKTEILQTSQEQITPEVEENLNTVSTGFEQVITLLGQVIKSIGYQRRLGVLTAVFQQEKESQGLDEGYEGIDERG